MSISTSARDLCGTGCGCDDDATEGCPNWNGERCTFQEYMIAKALLAAKVEGLREGGEIALGMIRNGRTLSSEIAAAIDRRIAELSSQEAGT